MHRRLSPPRQPANLVTSQRCRYCSGHAPRHHRADRSPCRGPACGRAGRRARGLTEQLLVMIRQADESYLAVETDDLRRAVRANLASFVGISPASDRRALPPRETPPSAGPARACRSGRCARLPAGLSRRSGARSPTGRCERPGGWTDWCAGRRRSGPGWTPAPRPSTPYRDALIESAREDEQRRMLLLDTLFEGRPGEWKMLGGSMPAIGLPERARTWRCQPNREPESRTCLRLASFCAARRGSAWRLRADEQAGLVAVNQDRPLPRSGNCSRRRPPAGSGSALSSTTPSTPTGCWRSPRSPGGACRRHHRRCHHRRRLGGDDGRRHAGHLGPELCTGFSAGSPILPAKSRNSCWAPCGPGSIVPVTPPPRHGICTPPQECGTGCNGLKS